VGGNERGGGSKVSRRKVKREIRDMIGGGVVGEMSGTGEG
jgi:hypothetical protein